MQAFIQILTKNILKYSQKFYFLKNQYFSFANIHNLSIKKY